MFKKLLFFIKRPCAVFLIGKENLFIRKILKNKCQIFRPDLEKIEKFKFFIKRSKLPIFIIDSIENRVDITKIKKIVHNTSYYGYLILNSDNENIREIKNLSEAHSLTYGFQKKVDLNVSDINTDEQGTNFKINYQGNIVPFWFEHSLKKKQIYNILSAIAVGIINGLNLVEISQALK